MEDTVEKVPEKEQQGTINSNELRFVISLIDRLVQGGGVKGDEVLAIGIVRQKMISLVEHVEKGNS